MLQTKFVRTLYTASGEFSITGFDADLHKHGETILATDPGVYDISGQPSDATRHFPPVAN
jgi:hypothetical protein